MTTLERQFLASRGRLFGLAYRMLGSAADAEDIVQETWLRARNAAADDIRSPEGFFVTIATRLCLDQLKSARRRRETYVGPWLPEPLVEDLAPGTDHQTPESALALADDLSFALMVTLEKLSPPERAAFLLHDVFDTPFAQIALALGKTEAACRQLAARARKAIRSARPARAASRDEHTQLLARFTEAVASGDAGRLETLLTDDAIAWSDGGGVKLAALNPIIGARNIARFFTGLANKNRAAGAAITARLADINGAPGMLVFIDGALDQTLSLDIADGRIKAVFVVRNPQKLRAIAG